jgi:hypothetical protein
MFALVAIVKGMWGQQSALTLAAATTTTTTTDTVFYSKLSTMSEKNWVED